MPYNQYDIVLVKGTALDVGSFNHQPWSAMIGDREQLTERFLWINPKDPSLRAIEIDDPILFIVPIHKVENGYYYSETHHDTQPYLVFTDKDILRKAPLNQFLEKPTTTPVEKLKVVPVKKQEPELTVEASEPNAEHSDEPVNYIGSDEVGNGSYFGGIITASVYIKDQKDVDFLLDLGVRDSKKLSDKKIKEMAPQIKDYLEHSISAAIPQQYNQAIASGLNIKEIMAVLHNDALSKLKDIDPEFVMIDQFAPLATYRKYLSNKEIAYDDRLRVETKADGKYLAVAAASILARDAFLTQIDTMSDYLKKTFKSALTMPLKQGVTAKSKEQIAQMMKLNIDLTHYGKIDFKTTEEVRQSLGLENAN